MDPVIRKAGNVRRRRFARWTGAALFTLLAGASAAFAQAVTVSPFTAAPGGPTFAPPPPSMTPAPPVQQPRAPLVAPAPMREPHTSIPTVAPGKIALALAARYSDDGPYILRAITWRVFAEKALPSGAPLLAAEATEPYPVFALAPGTYVVHAGYGLANATRRVTLRNEARRETLVVAAGGLRLQGKVGESVIPSGRLRYDIYEGSFLQRAGASARADRPPVARGVAPGDLVLLPTGSYYVQSTYGEGNAVIQADVRVEAGRLTDAMVHHRAAQITLKLVNVSGGEALANTAWSVMTPGGDTIKESIGAFPIMVLAEGEYVAIARHDGKIYSDNFKVQTGRDREVEILAR
jgi:propanediol dehydratase small subunit